LHAGSITIDSAKVEHSYSASSISNSTTTSIVKGPRKIQRYDAYKLPIVINGYKALPAVARRYSPNQKRQLRNRMGLAKRLYVTPSLRFSNEKGVTLKRLQKDVRLCLDTPETEGVLREIYHDD